jgi:superfamily I DNA and/or RNA helicase
MNEAEAEKVVFYVKKILAAGKSQSDIGVVTPYRRQVIVN